MKPLPLPVEKTPFGPSARSPNEEPGGSDTVGYLAQDGVTVVDDALSSMAFDLTGRLLWKAKSWNRYGIFESLCTTSIHLIRTRRVRHLWSGKTVIHYVPDDDENTGNPLDRIAEHRHGTPLNGLFRHGNCRTFSSQCKVAAGAVLIMHNADERCRSVLTANDIKTGKMLWSVPFNDGQRDPEPADDCLVCHPILARGMIIAVTSQGVIYAFGPPTQVSSAPATHGRHRI